MLDGGSFQSRVKVFNANDGELVLMLDLPGPTREESLKGVAWSPSGDRIAVADYHNKRVRIFSAGGAFIGDLGSYGDGDEEYDSPGPIAWSPVGDRIAVIERDRMHIKIFGVHGDFDLLLGS